MAQARVASQELARVSVVAPGPLAATAIATLRARGIDCATGEAESVARSRRAANDAPSPTDGELVASAGRAGVLAWAFDTSPSATTVVELAAICARAAASGRPVCVLAPLVTGTGRMGIERAAALAYMRAHGAAVAHDVDAWLEAIVMLVRFGVPAGPRVAVVAPPGSWLRAQVLAVEAEAELATARPALAGDDEPTDVVLFDPTLDEAPPAGATLAIPVVPRAELAGERVALYGARGAVAAVALLGRAAQRIAIGLGPAPHEAAAELNVNRELLARQLDTVAKVVADQTNHGEPARIGDHDTKVLLRAYGVEITRQGIADTPSAAVSKARALGYPVELKPSGHHLPTEPAGCPVEHGVRSDALVRRAYTAVLSAAGGTPETDGDAAEQEPGSLGRVIVREAPPPGRELAVAFVKLPALGWTVVLDAPGAAQIAAAPAPLRLVDADALATRVVASRAGEPEPDRAGLANLLRRASHLVVDLDARIVRLELPRVVVGGRGARTLVVDAFAELA